MKALIRKAGCEKAITVDSVAATTEEIGNDMYPPAKRMLTKKGIPFSSRRARLITASDYARADYILCMDEENLADLARLTCGDPEKKSLSSSPGQDGAPRWQIRGIREISRRRMRISSKAVKRCWKAYAGKALPALGECSFVDRCQWSCLKSVIRFPFIHRVVHSYSRNCELRKPPLRSSDNQLNIALVHLRYTQKIVNICEQVQDAHAALSEKSRFCRTVSPPWLCSQLWIL